MKKLMVSVVGLAMSMGIANAEKCKDFDSNFNVIEYECGTSLDDAIKAKEAKQEKKMDRIEQELFKSESKKTVKSEPKNYLQFLGNIKIKFLIDAGAQYGTQKYKLPDYDVSMGTDLAVLASIGAQFEFDKYIAFARFGYQTLSSDTTKKGSETVTFFDGYYNMNEYVYTGEIKADNGHKFFLDFAGGMKLNKNMNVYGGLGIGFSTLETETNLSEAWYQNGLLKDAGPIANIKDDCSYTEGKIFFGGDYQLVNHVKVFVEPALHIIKGDTSFSGTAGIRLTF